MACLSGTARYELKINKIDHISVAVRDLDQARRVWEPVLENTRDAMAELEEKNYSFIGGARSF